MESHSPAAADAPLASLLSLPDAAVLEVLRKLDGRSLVMLGCTARYFGRRDPASRLPLTEAVAREALLADCTPEQAERFRWGWRAWGGGGGAGRGQGGGGGRWRPPSQERARARLFAGRPPHTPPRRPRLRIGPRGEGTGDPLEQMGRRGRGRGAGAWGCPVAAQCGRALPV